MLSGDDNLCRVFLQQCFNEDKWQYLFDILLECTDSTARQHVGLLIKFILVRLKSVEKDRLTEVEPLVNEAGEKVGERFVALSSRFIAQSVSILNTQVAKNWGRFDSFLEILYIFALGSEITPSEGEPEDESGLEFLF